MGFPFLRISLRFEPSLHATATGAERPVVNATTNLISSLKPVAVSAASGSLAATVLGGCRLARRKRRYTRERRARCPFQVEPTHWRSRKAKRALAEANYNASRFLQMLHEHRGLETARILLHATRVSEGYTALWERRRLDLAVEAVIHDNPKWHPLFSEEDLAICTRRLTQYGYLTDTE